MSTQPENVIIARALDERNPSVLTNYYVRPEVGGYQVFPGSVRFAKYLTHWQELGKPKEFVSASAGLPFYVEPRMVGSEMIFFEKRGFIFLPWQLEFYRAKQEERVIIGTTGTGKTAGIGMLAMSLAAMIPNFRFLNVAPRLYQSELMVRAIQDQILGTSFPSVFLKAGKQGYRERPYSLYRFQNGSTCEFMNVENNAKNVQSWSGDWINVDEAGLLDDLDEEGAPQLSQMLIGLATRLRGIRPDGRPRLGWLSMISMAYANDTLWQRFELGESLPDTYYTRKVLHKDNPTLTPADIERIKRNIPPGQEEQWLEGKRPPVKGAEFPSRLIAEMFSPKAFDPEARFERAGCGIVEYFVEPVKDHVYVLAGDPGMSDPPHRNSPCIMLWDVTKFPHEKARMVGFWWGYGNGSILPFINKFDELMSRYVVAEAFRGYDSTSSQKSIAELAWSTGDKAVVPLGFDGSKKWMYINSAKILMSKNLLLAPPIEGFKAQMQTYKLPDKKIPQDIVSTFCMAAHLMIPLYRDVYPDEDNTLEQVEDRLDKLADSNDRFSRIYSDRHNGRG